MISIPDKAKQFLIVVTKLLIVSGALYFVYQQLANNDQLDWKQFYVLFKKNLSVSGIVPILFLSYLNRYFEIIKWQNLISSFKKISINEATKQVLGSMTTGIFTPNGIGEYAGKSLFFEKVKIKKIIFLNLVCNGIQMILTVLFGTIGLWVLGFEFWVLSILVFFIFLILFSFLLKEIKINGYSLEKLKHKINEIPKSIHQKNILLGLGRYLIFSHQYFFLYKAFDVNLPYFTLMATIACVYFLASSLPNFQFFDFAVKGSIAVFFFGNLGVNEWIVVFITTLIWFLNVVIPVVIGSYYVIKFSPQMGD